MSGPGFAFSLYFLLSWNMLLLTMLQGELFIVLEKFLVITAAYYLSFKENFIANEIFNFES